MRPRPEAIRWWRLDDRVAKAWKRIRKALFLSPLIWFLKFYDDYWASRFRRRPDIHELTRRARGEVPIDAPVPLPVRRRRALTSPLPPLESIRSVSYSIRRARQRDESQSASPFCTKLPTEIRHMIYDLVLVGEESERLVHILRKHGRLGHWRCRIPGNGDDICDPEARRCVEGWLAYKAKVWHWDKAGRVDLITDRDVLPLLLTCRKIYSEGIGIIYSKNLFHFYDPGDIRYFARTILPQRLNQVQSIVIDWERAFSIFNKDNSIPKLDDDELKAWRKTWEIISKMQGLLDVKIVLRPHQFHVPIERRRRMCSLLADIHGLRKFELVVPAEDPTDWSFADGAPFTVIKTQNLIVEEIT